MIGLPDAQRPVMRAYSIASPHFAEELEFLSIKVEGGALTSRLRDIQPGDHVLLGKKATGTLVLDALTPGKRLFLLATGTGLAPFLSILRDPAAYEAYEKIILVHCVRRTSELAYRKLLAHDIADDPLIGELARDQLIYLPTVTREAFDRMGRITHRINDGRLFADVGLNRTRFDPTEDRVMVCGSLDMIEEVSALLIKQGLAMGANAAPGEFVIERAFAG